MSYSAEQILMLQTHRHLETDSLPVCYFKIAELVENLSQHESHDQQFTNKEVQKT